MTRRDFVAIAAALKSIKPQAGAPAEAVFMWRQAVMALCGHCAAVNSHFDGDRFRRACGLD